MRPGRVELAIIGNMASGKTGDICNEVRRRMDYKHQRIVLFKPSTDTRSAPGTIQSRDKHSFPAIEVPGRHPWEMFHSLKDEERKLGQKMHVVAIDEFQFFEPESGVLELVEFLLREGYGLIIAGLPLDFRGQPFEVVSHMVTLAQNRVKCLESFCAKCGEPADYPQRLIKGEPADYSSPRIMVDQSGEVTYEPRCGSCYQLPDREGKNIILPKPRVVSIGAGS